MVRDILTNPKKLILLLICIALLLIAAIMNVVQWANRVTSALQLPPYVEYPVDVSLVESKDRDIIRGVEALIYDDYTLLTVIDVEGDGKPEGIGYLPSKIKPKQPIKDAIVVSELRFFNEMRTPQLTVKVNYGITAWTQDVDRSLFRQYYGGAAYQVLVNQGRLLTAVPLDEDGNAITGPISVEWLPGKGYVRVSSPANLSK